MTSFEAAFPVEQVPGPVRAVLEQLEARGHRAYLVGGCVRDLVRGAPVQDFDVATAAPPEAVLAIFPRAVPTGIRHGTVMVPTAAGPVDVTHFRAGPRLEDDLARRDFSVNALAWEPRSARVLDPFDGLSDLRAGRLRAVGSADARLAEDPVRALRAARLVAQLGLRVDPALERAMARVAKKLADVARERIQHELAALLCAEGVRDGLALLRRSGLEAIVAPGVAPDAAEVVGRLPRQLDVRLAGWLRGADAAAILGRLRFPRRVVERVARWVALHPVEKAADPQSLASVRRLLRRAGGDADLAVLLRLRETELDLAGGTSAADVARRRLAELQGTLARVRRGGALALRRRDLALGGREVMAILGCGPGPRVGAALRHLTECVIEDPRCNTPGGLRACLAAWAASPASGHHAGRAG